MYGRLPAQCYVSRENIKSHPFNPPGFDLHEVFLKSCFQCPLSLPTPKAEGNWKSQEQTLIAPKDFLSEMCAKVREEK